ncbi:hypothetical protein [Nocardia wallacei]|uniref:hypothetical protein n=1 Tax=Nocardia wallacei TaxID=480035 RepID=UPI0024566280|nr:hypothetical protein [Nocardia wallacei]
MTDQNDAAVNVPTAAVTIDVGLSVSVAIRGYLASQHLWAARRAAREARQIENRLAGSGHASVELEAATTNAIFLSVAFIEASVNEVLQDLAESEPGKLNSRCAGIGEDTARMVRALWQQPARLERAGVLEKYQVALAAAHQPPLDAGQKPFQWAKKLIGLRNALIHFKPEWQADDEQHAQEKELKGLFATSTIFTGPVQPWYPRACLATGCAEWANATAVDFVDTWWKKMGLRRDYHEDLRGMPTP